MFHSSAGRDIGVYESGCGTGKVVDDILPTVGGSSGLIPIRSRGWINMFATPLWGPTLLPTTRLLGTWRATRLPPTMSAEWWKRLNIAMVVDWNNSYNSPTPGDCGRDYALSQTTKHHTHPRWVPMLLWLMNWTTSLCTLSRQTAVLPARGEETFTLTRVWREEGV